MDKTLPAHGSRTLLTRGSIERMHSLVRGSSVQEPPPKAGCEPIAAKLKWPATLSDQRRGIHMFVVYLLCLPAVMSRKIHNSLGIAATFFAFSGLPLVDQSCGGALLKGIDAYIGATCAFLMVSPALIGLVISGKTQSLPNIWINWGLVLVAVISAFFWNYLIVLLPEHHVIFRRGITILAFFTMQTNIGPADPSLKNIITYLFNLKDYPVQTFQDGYVSQVVKSLIGTFAGVTIASLVMAYVFPDRAEHKLMSNLEMSLRKIENIMVPLIALDSGIVENESIFKGLVHHDLVIDSRNMDFADFIDIKTKIWNHIEDAYRLLQPNKLLIEAARVEKLVPVIYFGRLRTLSASVNAPRLSRRGSLKPEVHTIEPEVSFWEQVKRWYAEDCIRPRMLFSNFSHQLYEASVENVLALFFHVTSLYLVLETNEAILNDGIISNDHMAWGATLRVGNDLMSISKNKSPNIRKYLTEPDINIFCKNAVAEESALPMRKGFLLSGLSLPRSSETSNSHEQLPSEECHDEVHEDGYTIYAPPPSMCELGGRSLQPVRSVHDLSSLEVVGFIGKSTVHLDQTAELETCMQPLIKWSKDFGPCIGRISQNVAAYIQSLGDSVAARRINERVYAELSEVRYSLKELCLRRRTWQTKTEDVLKINLANMCHQGNTVLSRDPIYIREMLEEVLGVSVEDYSRMNVTARGLLWSNLGYVRDKMARFSCLIVVLASQLHQCREPITALLNNR